MKKKIMAFSVFFALFLAGSFLYVSRPNKTVEHTEAFHPRPAYSRQVEKVPTHPVAVPDESHADSVVKSGAVTPLKIIFTTNGTIFRKPELDSLVTVVSGIVSEANGFIESGDFETHTFSGTTWFTKIDDKTRRRWNMYPCGGTGRVIGSIDVRTYVYFNGTSVQYTNGFYVSFQPETGEILKVSDSERGEYLTTRKDSLFAADYSRRLEGNREMRLRWDVSGALISSNIFRRGPIRVVSYGNTNLPPSSVAP